MSGFVSSPVWGAIIAIAGTVTIAIVGMFARLISKVNAISSKMDSIAEDVTEIKEDKDVMRWSDLGRRKIRRRRSDF